MTRVLKMILCGTLLALCGAMALSAQDAGAPAEWYVDKPIKAFAFKGLVTVKESDLQPVLASYVGKKFSTDPLLMDITATLYALDYFDSIESDALPGDEARSSLIIEFTVKEMPSLTAIEVTGNATLRTNEITDKIVLKKGDLANKTKLAADVDAVKSLYLDKGYTDANVTAGFVPSAGENTVKAVFTITEGTPTTIKEIHFSGNSFASESTLKGVMKTKAQFLFDSGVFQESKLEEDKASLVSYYTDRGFVDAKVEKVTRDIQSQDGRNFLILTIYLSEGEQWTYGGMSFVGNAIFASPRLAELAYQKPGKNVSLQKLQADISRIRFLYYDNGYIFNAFNLTEKRDAAAKSINYTLTIQELDKAHIESIIFKGNTRTKENVLRRGLAFEEGDIFDRAKYALGYQYLVNLQYFKTVTPDVQQGSEMGLMNIIYSLEETSTADVNFGVVFSSGEYPVSGTIKLNERNFQGKGQTLGVDLEVSSLKQLVSFNFTEPWMLNLPWSGSIALSFDHETKSSVLQDILGPVFTDDQQAIAAPDPFATREDYLAALTAGDSIDSQYLMTYDSYEIGLTAATGYTFSLGASRLGLSMSYAPTLRYIDYDETLYRAFEKNVRDNNHDWIFIDKVSLSAALDGRDIYWNPTNGYYLSQSVSLVGGVLFGDRDYIRTVSTGEVFVTLLNLPVFEQWNLQFVLAAHSALSLILPNFAYSADAGGWIWETNTDYTDQLYIDGMTVGRGWRQMYGNALWDNRLELRMPIQKDIVWLVGFMDAAALWDEPFNAVSPETSMDRMSLDDFCFSIGGGLRFAITQLPIRLYIAKGFKLSDENGGLAVNWKPGDLSIGDWSFSFVISLGGNVF
jgi:outer membrane protein insertion porin family